ncbi:MAG TPA: hypothetical protein VD902_10510 [Symbiobacteriaceae bacterium]|nr:hypothetical protein [Symbiobacteriaceae bacterium]
MNNPIQNPVVKTTAMGAGVGAAGGWGLSATMGVGLAITGTAVAMPAVVAGAALGGLLGLAYGLGRR